MATTTTNLGLLKPLTSETFDLSEYNSNLDKIDSGVNNPTPTQTKLPLGLVAGNDATSNGAATTGLQVEMNIASFTFKANRWYEIEYTTGVMTAAAATSPLAQIQSCSTSDAANLTTGLTELMGFNIVTTAASAPVRVNCKRKIKYTVDTTLQIKATTNGNSVSTTRTAGPTYPSQLYITDKGQEM